MKACGDKMSVYKYRRLDKFYNISIGFFLIIAAFTCIYPVLYIIFASFSEPGLLMKHTGLLLSSLGFTTKGYEIAFSYAGVRQGYLNTIFVVAVGTTVNLILTVLGAFGLSRKGMMLRKPITLLITFTMFFNGGLIPTYMVVKGVGLVDSLFSLILPVAVNTINLIILRTSMVALPASVEESAKMDGANDITLLVKIIIPLVAPTMAVLALYYIVGHWNSWFTAYLFIKTRTKYPLQLVLREILIANTSNAAQTQGMDLSEMDLYKRLVKYCTTIIATLPILFIYPFMQKYFVNGVMLGSIKE